MTRASLGAVAALLFMAPTICLGLGLGAVRVHSTLEEPLRADIPLISPTADELAELAVRLAPESAFQRAGISYPFWLRELRFQVTGGRDQPRIAIVTEEVMREPTVNFLLEVSWPGGRLLREYSILLDPPARFRRGGPVRLRAAPSVPREYRDSFSAGSGASRASGRSRSAEAGKIRDGSYGPVSRGETLSSIASLTRPGSGVGLAEMMQALLRANPDAFFENNIDSLKAGAVLRIPAADEIAAGTVQPRPSAAAAPAPEPTAPAEPRVRLVTPPTQDTGAQVAAEAGQPTTTVPVDPSQVLATATGLVRVENGRLTLKLAGIDAFRRRVSRLQAMEDPGPQAPVAAAVDPATAQALAETKPEEPSGVTSPGRVDAPAVDESTQPEPVPGVDAGPVAETAVDTAVPLEPLPPEPGTLESGSATIEESTAPVAALDLPAAPRADSEPALSDAPSRSEPSWQQKLMQFVGERRTALLLGLMLLLALIWLLLRRRSVDGTAEPVAQASRRVAPAEPEPAPTVPPAAPPVAAAGAAAAAAVLATEAQTGPQVSSSDGDNTLERADFLNRMGQQVDAVQVLRDQLLRNPADSPAALKLLQIYADANNRDAFVLEAGLRRDMLQQAGCWDQVEKLGEVIAPDHRLFGGSTEPEEIPAATVVRGDRSAPAREPPESLEDELSLEDLDLESLQLDELGDATAAAPAGEPEAKPVAGWQLDDKTPVEPPSADGGAPKDKGRDLPPDIDEASIAAPLEDVERHPVEAKEAGGADEDWTIAFDLDDLDLGPEPEEEEEKTATPPGSVPVAQEAPTSEDQNPETEGESVDTKLELAVAYADVGDSDVSRELCQEVIREGSPEQRRRAEEILASLGE